MLALTTLVAARAQAMNLGLPEKYRLRNGLQLVVLRDRSTPLIGMAVAVPAGATTEGPGTRGYGHLLANVWQSLAWDAPARALRERLEDSGAFAGAVHLQDIVVGNATLPADQWKGALELASSWLRVRDVDEATLDEARRRALRALSQKPRFPLTQGLLADRLRTLVYGNHPLGNPRDGDEEDLKAASPARLAARLGQVLAPNQAAVVLVGDVPEVDPLLDEALVRFTMDAGKGLAAPPPPEPGAGAERREAADVERAVGEVGYRVPGVDHDDFAPLYLLRHLLASGPGSLLDQQLVVRDGLLASIRGDLSILGSDNLLSFQMEARGDRIETAAQAVVRACARMAARTPDPEVLADARRGLKATRALRLQDRTAKAMLMAQAELLGGLDILEDVPYRLDQVTPEDVRRVAARYLAPERAFLVELHPRGAEDPGTADTQRRSFSRGLELAFRQDRSTEVVGLALAFPGGAGIEPEDMPGLSGLLEAYLAEAGTAREPRVRTERRLQRNGAHIRAGSGGTWWCALGLTATVYGFEELTQTLRDAVVEPRWDPATFTRVRDHVTARWRRFVESPQDDGHWRVYEELYRGRAHVPQARRVLEGLPRYTLDDLKALHAAILARQHWVLGVSGSLDLAKVEEVVQSSFQVTRTAQPHAFGETREPGVATPEVRALTVPTEVDYDSLWVGVPLPGEAIDDLAPVSVWFNLLGFRADSALRTRLRALDSSLEVVHRSIHMPPQGGAMTFGFRLKRGAGAAAAAAAAEVLRQLPQRSVDEATLSQTARRVGTALAVQNQDKPREALELATNTLVLGESDLDRKLLASYARMTRPEVERAASYLAGGLVILYQGREP